MSACGPRTTPPIRDKPSGGRPSPPEQLALDVLRAVGVVLPVGQGSHVGVRDGALPPADQLPTAHSWQPALPNPGRHTVFRRQGGRQQRGVASASQEGEGSDVFTVVCGGLPSRLADSMPTISRECREHKRFCAQTSPRTSHPPPSQPTKAHLCSLLPRWPRKQGW